jgi:stage V sporulation protein SpoVS
MIIGDVQTIWDQAQLAACKQFHDMFAGMKGSVATATAANPNMTCKDIKAQLRDEITKNIGAAAFNSGVDTVALTKNVEKLYTHVIDAVCVNDAVDVKKVDALMDALFAAVCYAA